uniref:PK_Tyr_Ser-Thr domain-containing protein n=1 Tax=Heterorhabditis bacteriophora TaxID=37862 RepID=A0A1I7X827_HETBA
MLGKGYVSTSTCDSPDMEFNMSVEFISLGHFISRLERKEALETRDRMIIPPRCAAKSQEIGLMNVTPWKEYFTREQPFIPP